MLADFLTPLPFLTAAVPGIGGRIKDRPEDFDVEEIPAYEPGGTGDHLYLFLEKTDMGAEFFTRQVARRLDIPPGEVGTAGLKDRRAVTRQWVSVPAFAEAALPGLEGEGIRILRTGRHSNKLKPGHLHGNRFTILVRDPNPDWTGPLGEALDVVRRLGLPNFYGPQRFGRGGETLHLGLQFLGVEPADRKLPRNPFLKKLALSSTQSALFNRCLAGRLHDGLYRQVLPGDVMAKWPFGGMFRADDVAAEQARFDARETIHAGPMFGKKTFPAAGLAAERESAVLAGAGLAPAAFGGFGKLLMGTRRHNLVYIDDLAFEAVPDGVKLQFTLPAGSYATVLLREVMKVAELDSTEAAEDRAEGM